MVVFTVLIGEFNMLTKEQKKTYEEQGYLIIKKLHHSGEIKDLDTHSNVRDMCWENDAKDALKQVTISKETTQWVQVDNSLMEFYNPATGNLLLERLNWIGNLDPFFLEISLDYRILSIVSILLSTLKAYHLVNQLNYKRPGSGFSIAWHQDAQFRHKACSDYPANKNKHGHSITVITAIDLCTSSNGTLYVLPNSHKLGFLNFQHNWMPQKIQPEFMEKYQIDIEASQISICLEPGDVLFMHEYLLHRSDVNKSAKSRRVLVNSFSSFEIDDHPKVSLAFSRLRSLFTQVRHSHHIAPKDSIVEQCEEHPKPLTDDESNESEIPPSKLNRYYNFNINYQFFKNNSNPELEAHPFISEVQRPR